MSKAAAFTAVEPKPTELTVFGQLQGATGLAASSAHCMWRISHGKTWTLERGEGSGSSQTAEPVHRVMRPVAMKSLPRRLEKLEVAFSVHFTLTRGAEEEPLDGGKL